MKVDLIALCTEETKQNTFNTICPLVQQKLNASSVEVLSTTVFCDLYAISKNLSRHLNTPTVLVGDFLSKIKIQVV